MTLQEFFTQHPKAALAFSGGTDSAYLLWAARQYGAQVQPYFIRTCFQPDFALAHARQLCRQLDLPLQIIDTDVLQTEAVRSNPPRRCYHCKKQMFTALQAQALADGYPCILDGTNADDDADDRPGMQALAELRVLSPLRLCGLTKAEIRRRSQQAGLFTWDMPAYACLATRIPTGTPICTDDLHRVEQAECALYDLGFADLRVRLRRKTALLQLPPAQLEKAVTQRESILTALRPYFDHITLDLEARG